MAARARATAARLISNLVIANLLIANLVIADNRSIAAFDLADGRLRACAGASKDDTLLSAGCMFVGQIKTMRPAVAARIG
jgi:hypothetical protein